MNPILALATANEVPLPLGVAKAPTEGAAAFLALIAAVLTGQPSVAVTMNPTATPDGSTPDPLAAMQDEADEQPGDPTQVPVPVPPVTPQAAPAPMAVTPDQPVSLSPALAANDASPPEATPATPPAPAPSAAAPVEPDSDAAPAAQPAPTTAAPIEPGSEVALTAGTAIPAPGAPVPNPSDDAVPTSPAKLTPQRANGTEEGQRPPAPPRPATAAGQQPAPPAGVNGVAAVLGDASDRVDAPRTPPTRPTVPTEFPKIAADTAQALVVSRVWGADPKVSGTAADTAPPATTVLPRPLEERPDLALDRPSPTLAVGAPAARTETQHAPVARRAPVTSPRPTASDSSMPRGIPLTTGLNASPASHDAALSATVATTFFAAFDEPDATTGAEPARPATSAPTAVVAASADMARPSATPAAGADADPLPQAAPAERIAVAIRRAVHEGIDRIRIRLWPAELGHVDVTLHVGRDHRVGMTVAVDRPETLDLLQRDARGLERALADSGFKLDSGNLAFNLRHGGQGGGNGGQAQPTPDEVAASIVPTITDAAPNPVHFDRLRLVDLHA